MPGGQKTGRSTSIQLVEPCKSGIPKDKHKLYDLISRFSCGLMRIGEVYMRRKCGLELLVSHECRRNPSDAPCCVLACCGQEMVKKEV